MFRRKYSLKKSHQIFQSGYAWYRKQKENLSQQAKERLADRLEKLEEAVIAKERSRAEELAKEVEAELNHHGSRSLFSIAKELTIALLIALVAATVVRQMWFEHYEIPTGSMRPTYREKDRLLSSKTIFGLNVPLQKKHFFFDPDLVQRADVVTWTGEDIGLLDNDTLYFGLFPGKKRYVKRLMGKPGDTLYFYGGRIYGLDKEGEEITPSLQPEWLKEREYIPFTRFTGRVEAESKGRVIPQVTLTFYHFNQPLGRFVLRTPQIGEGFVREENEWVPATLADGEFLDHWGMQNFALARMTNRTGDYALTLRFRPTLAEPPALQRMGNRLAGLRLDAKSASIPLDESALDSLWNALYTVRFRVRGGLAYPYRQDSSAIPPNALTLPGVPEGIYEFEGGKAYSVAEGGTRTQLSYSHPLFDERSPERLQLLFNGGIEMSSDLLEDPQEMPSRYAYWREGTLFVLGHPLFQADSPFVQDLSAFPDEGPPSRERIESQGLKVPEGHYLLLGDNHARSSDSRWFGFLPEANLRGGASFLLWPLDKRWGVQLNSPRPWLNGPTLFVWLLAISLLGGWIWHNRRQRSKKTFQR